MRRALLVAFLAAVALGPEAIAAPGELASLVEEDANWWHDKGRLPVSDLETRFAGPHKQTAELLSAIITGNPMTLGSLTVIPLLLPDGERPGPIVLGSADPPLAAADSGAELQSFRNASSQRRLALVGEVLDGTMTTQDRILERSMIFEPRSAAFGSTFCCQQDLVAVRGNPLVMTGRLAPAGLRAHLVTDYQAALRMGLGGGTGPAAGVIRRTADGTPPWVSPTQEMIWLGISERLRLAGLESPTQAYLDLVRARRAPVLTVELPPNTCGIAVGWGDELVSVECFGSPAQLDSLGRQELLASHLPAGDAVGQQPANADAVLGAWTRLAACLPPPEFYLADPERVVTIHFRAGAMAGCALTSGGAPVHIFLASPR